MGVNANGRISLGVGIDEGQIKQSASQVKAILNKEISTVNLDQFFNDKKIQQAVQNSIEGINKVLAKSKFKNLDFSTLIPRVDSIMSNTNLAEDMRSQIISGLSYQFQNLDKYASKDIISLLSDSNIMEAYTKDLTNIVDFVRSIKGLSIKDQDKMIKSLNKADISDIATAFTLKDLQGTYGSNLKFKMKPKEIIPLLNDKLIDNLDPTNEDQLRNFLGIYNRAKYLAQTDTRKDKDGNIIKGKFATLFEQFQEKYHQEIEAFRTQYSDIYNQMERNVMGMSKDFDSIYNTKYKNKALDSSELVRGLKIDRTANQIYDTEADKAPTTTREVADTVLDVKSDVAELDKKVEEAEKLANEAKGAADEVKKKTQEKNKSIQKKDEPKVSSKENKKQNEGQTQNTASLDQAKDAIEEKTQDIERSIEELKAEREQLESEKEATEKTKEYLEKENNNINKIIKGQYKDQSKKDNYDRLKRQHDNYKEKQKAFNQADETLNSFEIGSDDYYKYISTWQQARKEEQLAWVTYYKAYDVAKNGKNQVAKSRLDKYAPDETIHFDEDELESYINSLQERLDKNKDSIERINQEITDYVKKIDELKENIKEKDTAEKEIEGNTQSSPSPSSTSSNKSNSSNQTKPNIPIDLMGDLENAFGIDFNTADESSDIDSVAQAEENLREEADKTNDSLEEQKGTIDGITNTAEKLMYHMGQMKNNKFVPTNVFGEELSKTNESNIGTGLSVVGTPKESFKSVLSNEDLNEYFAIDTSELKMYEAHAEETAKEFYDFIHHLEQYCISMGSNFEGFDDNLENINEEALYTTAQKLFPDLGTYFNDFDEFYEYINEMIDLVSKSGIKADGTFDKIKMHLFQRENGTDDIKTRFLKELGYQGIDLSGTKYGTSTIFNPLDNIKIVASGKNIEEVIKQAIDKTSSKQEKDVEETKPQSSQPKSQTSGTTNTKKAIEEQEELEKKTKKATDALENQQQVLSQSKKGEEKTPQSSSKKDGEQNQDKQDKPSKPSAKLKSKKLPNVSAVEKPSTNEVKQGEADSANEANNEVGSFKLIAGSAEEAAEAKKKFVEANKEVLQSIIGSIPKIEQEAEALEKVNDVPQDNILDNVDVEQNKPSPTPAQNITEGINDQSLEIEEAYLEAASKVENSRNIYEEAIEGIVENNNEERIQEENKKRLKEEQERILKEEQAKQLILEQEKKQQEELLKQQEQAKAKAEAQRVIDEKKLKEKLEKQYKITTNKKDYIQNEDVSEKFLEAYNDIPTEKTQELFKTLQQLKQVKNSLQDSFDTEGNLLGDPRQVEQTYEAYNKLIETARRLKLEISGNYSEETAALKIEQDAKNAEKELNQLKVTIEKTFSKIRSSKDFIQGKDLNDNYLKQFGDKDSTKNLDNLKKTFEQLENIKFQLKLAFKDDDALIGDPTQTQLLLDRYDYLTEKIKRLKLIIESPNSGENILKEIVEDEEKTIEETEKLSNILEKAYSKLVNPEKITTSTEKFLQPYFNLSATETVDELINTIEQIQNISREISSSFNEQGELIGNPREVEGLIIEYNSLIKQVDILKQKISSPLSEENIALQLAKDAEKAQIEIDKLTQKAQKELENLKSTVDKTLGQTNLFEARTQKTIDTYGAYEGNGEGKKAEFITPEVVGEKYGENFKQQQTQVQELIKQLGLYKTAVEELRALRLSDETTVEQLTQANEKVKTLEQNITTLSQSIKTSGIANVTETQIEGLRTKFETLLKSAPNLTKDVREQIQEYVQTLSSGATVSKSAYNSMTADLRKFSAEQTRGSTIWEQMVGKMREGVAFLATKFSFYQIFNQFRQGFEVVHQFDDALTEMMKVSDETRLSLERYQKTTFDTADAIGTNALQIQNSTADFMRLGETLDEAAKSAKAANILMNVSEFQSIDEATKSLIAMGAAYDDLSKMNIIDKLNEIGNNYAISTSEAATALQSSASALKTANNDMDEALALITAGNAVVQDATKVGTGMRTIALRLTGKQVCPNIE